MIGMIEFSNVMAYPFSPSETRIQSYSSHLVLYYETCVLIVYSHPVLINFRKNPRISPWNSTLSINPLRSPGFFFPHPSCCEAVHLALTPDQNG